MSPSKPAAKLLAMALAACSVVLAIWIFTLMFRVFSGNHDLDSQLGKHVTVRYLTDGPAGTDHASGELVRIDEEWIAVQSRANQTAQMVETRVKVNPEQATTTWIARSPVSFPWK